MILKCDYSATVLLNEIEKGESFILSTGNHIQEVTRDISHTHYKVPLKSQCQLVKTMALL